MANTKISEMYPETLGNFTSPNVIQRLYHAKNGLVSIKVNFAVAATINLVVEGKVLASGTYAPLFTVTQADYTGSLGTNQAVMKAGPIMPHMRVVVTNANAGTAHRVSLLEY